MIQDSFPVLIDGSVWLFVKVIILLFVLAPCMLLCFHVSIRSDVVKRLNPCQFLFHDDFLGQAPAVQHVDS